MPDSAQLSRKNLQNCVMKAALSIQQDASSKLYLSHRSFGNLVNSNWLMRLEDLIASQIDNPNLSILDLAQGVYMSERQFFRKVKEQTGKTPNEYLRECRLQKARKLLYSGQFETLKEVAQQIGYKRVDYFSNLFEDRFGIRPTTLL